MGISLYERDDYITNLFNYKSIIKSYNKIIELKKKSNNRYFYLDIRMAVNPISNIVIIVHEEDLINLNSYITLIDFAHKLITYCKYKFKIVAITANQKDILHLLIKANYSTSSFKENEDYIRINRCYVTRDDRRRGLNSTYALWGKLDLAALKHKALLLPSKPKKKNINFFIRTLKVLGFKKYLDF